MAENSLVSEWIRRTALPETVEELLPTHDPSLSSYEWKTPLRAGANHTTVLRFSNVDYRVLLKLIPSMNSPESLALYYKHTSIQVRRAVCASPAVSPEQREYLLRWAIKKTDLEAMAGLSKSLTLEQLDWIDQSFPHFRSEISTAWCAALAREPDSKQRVVELIVAYASSQQSVHPRLESLVTHVVCGQVNGLTITETLAYIANPATARYVAAVAFAAAPRLTMELAVMAITHLNESDAPRVFQNKYRTSSTAESMTCRTTSYDEDAAIYIAERAKSKLIYNVVTWFNGPQKCPALIDALLDTCERAITETSTIHGISAGNAAMKVATAAFATGAQRNRAALVTNDLVWNNSLVGVGDALVEETWMRAIGEVVKHQAVLEPDVVLALMPALCATQVPAFAHWVFHQTECYTPDDATVAGLITEIASRTWGVPRLAKAMDARDLKWAYMAEKPVLLDLLIDSIGPAALELRTDPVIERIVQRLDQVCEGRPETALSVASLIQSGWETSLPELIETALLLSGHSLDEVGAERRMVQASLF